MSVEFINELIASANSCKVCLNCRYSYLQDETGYGFCSFANNAIPTGTPLSFLKPISEMHTCPHWEAKKNKLDAESH